jgi:hypothetical protein
MTNNKIYQEPEVKVVNLCFEGSVLVGSVQGGAKGEDVTVGEEYDPWA